MSQHTTSPFGTRLRQFREAAALSQEELAERAGLSLRGISDLERGLRVTPRLETVRMLADGLGLNPLERSLLLRARNERRRSTPLPRRIALPDLLRQPTSFIGRHQEIAAILETMERGDVQLLTLYGYGGVGKTRLALEVARRLVEESEQEVVVVDLSLVRRPELVLTAIASQLGMLDSPEARPRDVLQIVLQARPLVLVLDNVEQVVSAAADIAWLLATCPQLKILATSRVVLRITAEHVMEIEPFTLPTNECLDAIALNDAVSLFVARAYAANTWFTLNPDNAGTVVEIVNTLQGMPLAIELAAARIRLWPLAELRCQLRSQLSILTAGANDAPQRHRTMRDAITWSYDLLASREQEIFRCLAIFPTGCTLQTAVNVCSVGGRYGEAEIVDVIASLVDNSLLRAVAGPSDQVWYTMLQTVREFGLEQLDSAGEEETVRMAAHHGWCLPLAGQVEFLNARPDTVYWLRVLEAEWPNLRSHVSWLIAHDRVVEALDVAGSLASYRAVLGFLDEARSEMERLINDERNLTPTQARARARALIGMGNILFHADDTAIALEYFNAGAELARDLQEYLYLFFALICLCATNVFLGRLDTAEGHLNEAHEVVCAHDLVEQRPIVSLMRVHIAEQRGDWDTAYLLLREGVKGAHDQGLGFWEAVARLSLGYHLIRRNDLDEAESSMSLALELSQDVRDGREICGAYVGLAEIARRHGDHERTQVMLEYALESSRRTGSLRGMAESLLALARASLAASQPHVAESQVLEAIAWYRRCSYEVVAVTCLDVYADIAIELDMPERAAWCIGAVDEVLTTTGQSRAEHSVGEHQQRLDASRALLVPSAWQQHYDHGRSLTIAEVLAEVQSWSEADLTITSRTDIR